MRRCSPDWPPFSTMTPVSPSTRPSPASRWMPNSILVKYTSNGDADLNGQAGRLGLLPDRQGLLVEELGQSADRLSQRRLRLQRQDRRHRLLPDRQSFPLPAECRAGSARIERGRPCHGGHKTDGEGAGGKGQEETGNRQMDWADRVMRGLRSRKIRDAKELQAELGIYVPRASQVRLTSLGGLIHLAQGHGAGGVSSAVPVNTQYLEARNDDSRC